jgi:translocation and assembly module TamA
LDEVPVSKRFYTGGDQTVRGYEYEAIGSDNKLSDLVLGSDNQLSMIEGGQYLNVASVEYDWQFKPTWQSALFFDTGRAYIDPNERFSSGAGVGVRWLSPVGQLRFDIAQPVGNPDENSVRFHLFLGADL